MENKAISKIGRYLAKRIPETVVSAVFFCLSTVAFVLVMSVTKYNVWYSVIAAVLSFVLFDFCAIACVFAAGKEIRRSVLRQDPEQDVEVAGGPERPEKKQILKDVLLIAAGCALFALVTIGAVFLISKSMGVGGDFNGLIRFRFGTLDSQHYLYIAEYGYTPSTSDDYGRVVEIVFFPGYPITVKLLGMIIKDYFAAGMIVSFLCFTASAILLYLLMLEYFSRKDAIYSVILLFFMPGAFFFISPMTESMFLALTLATVYLIKKKKWFAAGICGMFCSFTRSAGIIVAGIFVFELFKEFLTEISTLRARSEKERGAVARTVWKYIARLIPAVIIFGGLAGFLVINKALNGDPFSFVYYEKKQWGQSLGWFFETAAYSAKDVVSYLSGQTGSNPYVGFSVFVMNLVAIFGITGTLAVKGRKLPASYVLYALAYFVISYGVTWLLSGMRYMDGLFIMPMALAASSGKYLLGSSPSEKSPESSKYVNGRLRSVLLITSMAILSVTYLVMFCARWQIW